MVVHDVYPDIMAACGLTTRYSLPFKLMSRINRHVLRRADSVFCIGRDMAEHLTATPGTGTASGIEVIPLWSDCQQIQPIPRKSNRRHLELGLANKLVVLYAGDMGYPQDIETLIAAAKRTYSMTLSHFLFIGSGPKQKLIEQTVASGSKNITRPPPVVI